MKLMTNNFTVFLQCTKLKEAACDSGNSAHTRAFITFYNKIIYTQHDDDDDGRHKIINIRTSFKPHRCVKASSVCIVYQHSRYIILQK